MNINQVKNWLTNAQRYLCPNTCLLCEVPTDQAVCDQCAPKLPRLKRFCPRCALPMDAVPGDNLICGECVADPPAFERVLAPFEYADPIAKLIGQFKYHHHLSAGRVLGEYLTQYVIEQGQTADLLLPVPLHPRRLRQRGFNQAAELAHWLSRGTKIPCQTGILQRTRPGPDQRGASRKERQQQVKGVFQVKDSDLPERVAVIDDVVTTGATARVIAHALRRAGVKHVQVWAVARTGKDSKHRTHQQ